MLEIVVTRGLPASGKSTWTREKMEQYPGKYKRVNRDLLREMIDNRAWSKAREKHIRQAELTLAQYFLSQGFSVIVDDTNLSPSSQEMWLELSRKLHVSHLIQDFTHVDVETCIERDRKRSNYVGERVIRRMYRDFLQPKPVTPEYDPNLPSAIICDLDGTLALMNGRNPYDASTCEQDSLNQAVAFILRAMHQLYDRGELCYIVLMSGREEQYREQTQRWLSKHEVQYDALYMRSTGDNRKDCIVKEELYRAHVLGKYNVRFTLDDRNQVVDLWRRLGLTCMQVAEGDF